MPHYEILKVLPDGSALWMDDTTDLASARLRLTELARKSPGEYLIYDRRTPSKAVYELRRDAP